MAYWLLRTTAMPQWRFRRRLEDLIGNDARGVIVLTCHALAMRLVGASFAGRANRLDNSDFREVLRQAVDQLRGKGLPQDEKQTNIGHDCSRVSAGYW